MANVYKRGAVYYGRATYKGKEFRESLETTSRADANQRLEEWLRRLKASHWGERPRRTFDETVRRFTAEHLPRLKPSSRKRYLQSLLVLADHFGDKHLDEIGRGALRTFESARHDQGRAN